MSWKLLHRQDKRARAAETYSKEIEEVYELESADDLDAFMCSFKKKGATLVEVRRGVAFYFTVDSVELERRPPMPNGRFQVVATIAVSVLKRSKELVAPWELAPYRFRVVTALTESSTTQFYPGVGDLWFPHGAFTAQPLVNTAGVALGGKTTYATTKIAFSYNVAADAFDPRTIWAPVGKINLTTTTVCGMTFPPRTLRLEAWNAEYCTESVETYAPDGAQITTYWKFYRVDAVLTCDPRSYDRLYANVGAHININGALHRIWRWTDPVKGTPDYGSYASYLATGATDGEQLSANVPLMKEGSAVAPIPTYRVGSPYEPVDFAKLGLPVEPPTVWNAIDA